MTRIKSDDDDDRILKDGESLRVSITARDTAQREFTARTARRADSQITDGRTTDPTALNRPGFRVPAVQDRKAVTDAYAERDFEDANAWRTDARRSSESGAGSSGPIGERPGDTCMTNAKEPGRLRMVKGQLQCVALRSGDDDFDDRSLDQRMTDHKQTMQQLYDARDRELSEMWKG